MLGVSGRDPTPAVEMQECVLDQMPPFVQFLVIRSWREPVFSGRNHRDQAPACDLIDDRLAVITVIGNQMRGRDPLHQAARWRAICHGPLRDNDSERHTLRIHGQRSLGVEPPVVRLIS